MGALIPIRHTADSVLTEFFAERQDLLVGIRLRRVLLAEGDLRACFEEHATAHLTEQERYLVEVERVFGERGAVIRAAHPATILRVLPVFLDEPRWHGRDLQDRRVRSQLGWLLARRLAYQPELCESEAFEAVRKAVQRARRGMRIASVEAEMRKLEARGIRFPALDEMLAQIREQGPRR